ncbi:hypothetical protein M728_005671 (plasmid) [Ensifer sp. WSM1721]|uniref:hypothetical protein n=1 Tax=Ensifer sp. WSM1721 TaxID=1041159 RepID=UPI0004B5844C
MRFYRLKMIKRAMYGRARPELLRARMLDLAFGLSVAPGQLDRVVDGVHIS